MEGGSNAGELPSCNYCHPERGEESHLPSLTIYVSTRSFATHRMTSSRFKGLCQSPATRPGVVDSRLLTNHPILTTEDCCVRGSGARLFRDAFEAKQPYFQRLQHHRASNALSRQNIASDRILAGLDQ